MEKDKKICFVIMGFGKKKDPYTNVIVDLDEIYNKIIKPSVEKNGLRCIRADEILESGIIDVSMYALLYKADLVIADITTFNPNAIYELGTRHVLKKSATIILSSSETKGVFDLDHIRRFNYSKYGEELNSKEIKEGQRLLSSLLESVINTPRIDSPLYTYFPNCKNPEIADEELEKIIQALKDKENSIYSLTEKAKHLEVIGNFLEAAKIWKKIADKNIDDDYYIQRQAYCTYMRNTPCELVDLIEASQLLSDIKVKENYETFGLLGSVYKRMYYIDKSAKTLEMAIHYYSKGWSLCHHYYPGENYANCIDLKYESLTSSSDTEERCWCKIESLKTRKSVIHLILDSLEEDDEDIMWKYASLSNCYLACGDNKNSDKYESLFLKENPTEAQIETFNNTKTNIKNLDYVKRL